MPIPPNNLVRRFDHLIGPSTDAPDISQLLTPLSDFIKNKFINHVTEFGFRSGASFCAFLMAQPETLVTYDTYIDQGWKEFYLANKGKTEVEFYEQSTLDAEIKPTEFLFIDTLHTYEQLSQELSIHGKKAAKYIGFHDTKTFETQGEDGKEPGLWAAITEFCEREGWDIHLHYPYNNGLTIIRKRSQWEGQQ